MNNFRRRVGGGQPVLVDERFICTNYDASGLEFSHGRTKETMYLSHYPEPDRWISGVNKYTMSGYIYVTGIREFQYSDGSVERSEETHSFYKYGGLDVLYYPGSNTGYVEFELDSDGSSDEGYYKLCSDRVSFGDDTIPCVLDVYAYDYMRDSFKYHKQNMFQITIERLFMGTGAYEGRYGITFSIQR